MKTAGSIPIVASFCILMGAGPSYACDELLNHIWWANTTTSVALSTIEDCDANLRGSNGKTPLHYAAQHGSFEAIQALFADGAYHSPRDSEGRIPLYMAAKRQNSEGRRIVAEFLSEGADVNSYSGYSKFSILVSAAHAKESPIIVKFLIEAGANVNLSSGAGNSPLMIAVQFGIPETVALLLEAGADPNVVDDIGITALMYAARGKWPENVIALLDAGADANVRINGGLGDYLTALSYAEGNPAIKSTEAYWRLHDARF